MQRLYSTFPEGWPGAGLVFLRAVTTIPIIQEGITGLTASPAPGIVQLAATAAAMLLLAGFWTPLAGVGIALAELCLAISHAADALMHVVLGMVGLALAMLGPGAWSVDARLFGRKRIRVPRPR